MHGTNITVRKRLTWTFLLASAAFLILVGRLAWVQFVRGDELQKKALEVRMRDVPVEAKRGTIYDRNGNELVTSISVDSIYCNPGHVKEPQDTAERLAPILDMDVDKLAEKLAKPSSFEWIKRKVDNKVASQIRELQNDGKISGIGFVEESKRYYLNSTLAAHVLGFTGIDNQGLIGIEKSYDEELRGEPGRIVVEHDAAGREVPEAMHQYIPAKKGSDLVLTIDETIQYFVERELDKVVAQYNPKFTLGIVMDPETGEILAMGTRPTFDANNWAEEPREVWDKNPAIWYNYEPGSTFKIITASAALEEGTVHPQDRFYDPGYATVSGEQIRCWKAGGHGSQSFVEVVENSCNTGFIAVGLNTGITKFYKYVNAFGFGQGTGISLPGEASGLVIPEKQATNLNLACMSIGQSIAVTPIQLITAISAVANDGVLMKPHLVKEIREEGKSAEEIKPEKVRQVISKDAAAQLRLLLESVVANGTGQGAFVEGYRIGGKTGTAQVVGEKGGYVSGRYVASFAGMAPVDDPKMVALVVIAEPQGGQYYGGVIAAPLFQGIAKDVLRYMQLPETPGLEKPKKPYEVEVPKVTVTVPNVVNYPVEEALRSLQAAGLEPQTNGEGLIVCDQVPKPGARVNNGTKVILELQPAGNKDSGEPVTVPNLKGMTIKEAGNILESMGLLLLPEGSGVAFSQDVQPGTKLKAGSTVKVTFKPPNYNNSSSQTPADQDNDIERLENLYAD
ncbi:stage V sporulation protein D (sporulation-specific penicillin-binding protein) [Desulfotomaculum arcticum]|uniref:Stage V sporulation protein D (Sporulation-specific penicillin-binding protein) n=1 Tax=Desulfotruncus arcticus DSM 17038 TaxID=1121424 RepID=A0A1I2QQ18_9FIRM|nr:stage V sporulation protein D [Desulfotruncus arcticus]SFG27746.1 stage V sporulation protein D (sporulation-specific penicillin-binding protein) [Desulfotomaculum arcticum] [Desulfotruncus arcticus DSM 17038]